jgi:integrase
MCSRPSGGHIVIAALPKIIKESLELRKILRHLLGQLMTEIVLSQRPQNRIKLTQLAVARLKPPKSGREEWWDAQLPGFGIRVSHTGRKTYQVLARISGRVARVAIGTTAVIENVGDARGRARMLFAQMQAGRDPVQERRAMRQAPAEKPPETFGEIADLYLRLYCEKNLRPRTIAFVRGVFERDARPLFGDRTIRDIGRRDVTLFVDRIAARGDVMANRSLSTLRTLFGWAKERGHVDENPCAGQKGPAAERSRDRVLTDHELTLFWRACADLGTPFGPMYRVLALTAQRRDEIAGMRWDELDFDKRIWTIPRARAKNDRGHEVHLSELAASILDAQPRFVGGQHVFAGRGSNAPSGFSKSKARLEELMLGLLRAETGDEHAVIPEWRLHDLRRTAASGMAKLNVPPHVVDRILNHVGGTIRGVAAVYNRHAYVDERKAALDRWAAHIEGLIRPGSCNVMAFKAPDEEAIPRSARG